MILKARFLETLRSEGWHVREMPMDRLPGALRQLLGEHPRVTAAGTYATEACRAAGLTPESRPQEDLPWGVVDATYGVAEPGSVAFQLGPEMPRWVLLVPQRLLVLLEAHRLVPDLEHLWTLAREQPDASWLLLHGPSVTADIEKVLVRGVHGPAELHLWWLR